MPVESRTDPAVWLIRDIEQSLAPSEQSTRELKLPQFQRSIVWPKWKQQDLIKSIRDGFPIGTLLLYQRHSTNERTTYLLVDGLQRVTAMTRYLRTPLSFMEAKDLPDDILSDLKSRLLLDLGTGSEELIARAITNWMQTTGGLDRASGFTSRTLLHNVLEAAGTESSLTASDQLYNVADEFLDRLQERIDIRGVSVPVIVYQGDEGHLPEIFQRINSGTALSRYETLAATWIDQETRIVNNQVRDAIGQKYAELMEEGFTVEGVGSDLSIERYSLFEYLFGLGKTLGDRYPALFPKRARPTETESIGFNLITVSCQLRLSGEMEQLPRRMPRNAEGLIDPTSLERRMLEAIDFVLSVLKPYIGLRLNERESAGLVAHTEYQIASLVARCLAGRYDVRTWEERQGWEVERETLRRTLPQHYLYDALLRFWRGSGDSRLFDMTWSRDSDKEAYRPSAHYLRTIPVSEWEQALDLWFEDQIQRVQRERPNVRTIEKLFLKFVYSGVVSYREEMQEVFELEHLFPVKRLRNLVGRDEEGWPISCISNLALFDRGTNRESSFKTIREYLDLIEDPAERRRRLERVEKYLLCDVSDVSIPILAGRDSLTRAAYESFLRQRFGRMKETLLRGLQIVSAPHEDQAQGN